MSKPTSEWSNKEVERDPERWHRLRDREREAEEKRREQFQEEQDFERFAKLYEQSGGSSSEARAAYDEFKHATARDRAIKLDERAQADMLTQRRRAV